MTADFTGVFQPVYTVRVAPSERIQIELIPGGESPAKLSLALRDRASLVPALVSHPDNGAILVLHMRWEEMREIYSAIADLAEKMDWPLPPSDAARDKRY